jgi:hypothetical protein
MAEDMRKTITAAHAHIDARSTIGACISVCADAPDERGRWRVQRWCADTLNLLHPASPGINAETAAAARRFGAWLATRQVRP